MKILVVGPSKNERARFIEKHFSTELSLLRDYVYETDSIEEIKKQEDVAQTYMILKDEDESMDSWMNYYNDFYLKQNIVWVSEF